MDVQRISDMTAGDTGFLEELVGIYVENARELSVRLHEAIRAADPDELEKAAHALKGASLNMGIPEVGRLAGVLLDIGREGSCEGAASVLSTLDNEITRAHEALEQLLREAA